MELKDAIALISNAVPLLPQHGEKQYWADLGCGTGLFTMALASLLPEDSLVYGVDTQPALPDTPRLRSIKADFVNDRLPLSGLNGIFMANSLHYVRDKPALIKKLQAYMRPGAPFIIVEYDTDTPVTRWVPYPLSYTSLVALFNSAGYKSIRKLGQRPSSYGRAELYAAIILP
ncbi:MAG: class I SAM-dependent methyltransferase [Bacteroidetes bacterium]|nr:class I SAM-dependent methyltransferase [Bacteroidota bacterium]